MPSNFLFEGICFFVAIGQGFGLLLVLLAALWGTASIPCPSAFYLGFFAIPRCWGSEFVFHNFPQQQRKFLDLFYYLKI